MAEVCLPHHTLTGMNMSRDHDTPQASPLIPSMSEPIPQHPDAPFVFPLQPSQPLAGNSHERTSSNVDTARSRRTTSRSRPSRLAIDDLPTFEFRGPPSSTSATAAGFSPSPTLSPVRKTPPPSGHPVGHRRGGSEFIGGDISHGGPMLLSTSPTATSSMGSTTPHPPTGPPPGRRGHAHRRSGAVSQSDIVKMMQSANENRGGSAPTTPSEPIFQGPPPPDFISQPASPYVGGESPIPPMGLRFGEHPRSRVGFSDHVEIIPRPLSTISSETSSSMSTVRANYSGHSVTDSITSIVSQGTSSPPSARGVSSSRGSFDYSRVKSRAGTAGSLRRSPSCDDRPFSPQELELTRRPSSAPASDVSFKKAESPKTPARHCGSDDQGVPAISSTSQNDLSSSAVDPTDVAIPKATMSSISTSDFTRPKTSPEPKASKRQRKVRSWAGSFLHRKDKHLLESASVNPPWQRAPEDTAQSSDFSLDDITFDEDTTCIIETPSPISSKPSRLQTSFSAWKPRESSPLSETDNSAMIDLDAALGSLDSTGFDHTFDEATGSYTGLKRRMHSSGETGGFTGPGMHYHRRAESAPELEPFDRSRFGLPRLGSNSTMGQAIEEEEEEGEEEGDGENVIIEQEEHTHGLGVNIVETGPIGNETMRRRRRMKPDSSDDRQARSFNSHGHNGISDLGTVEIVSAEEEPRFSAITKSSDEPTITPSLPRNTLISRPVSAPIDFALQTPSLTCSPETPSSVSSATYAKTSFDATDALRIHTATSSITDRVTLGSSRVWDQGVGSVDDIPSLTSSASMTSGQPARFSSSSNTTYSAERSSSLSAAVPPRTRTDNSSKRSSLASLSRLVGGPYNKSKLNIAETVAPDSPERSEKKKGRRISRMMKFWKSKEKLISA